MEKESNIHKGDSHSSRFKTCTEFIQSLKCRNSDPVEFVQTKSQLDSSFLSRRMLLGKNYDGILSVDDFILGLEKNERMVEETFISYSEEIKGLLNGIKDDISKQLDILQGELIGKYLAENIKTPQWMERIRLFNAFHMNIERNKANPAEGRSAALTALNKLIEVQSSPIGAPGKNLDLGEIKKLVQKRKEAVQLDISHLREEVIAIFNQSRRDLRNNEPHYSKYSSMGPDNQNGRGGGQPKRNFISFCMTSRDTIQERKLNNHKSWDIEAWDNSENVNIDKMMMGLLSKKSFVGIDACKEVDELRCPKGICLKSGGIHVDSSITTKKYILDREGNFRFIETNSTGSELTPSNIQEIIQAYELGEPNSEYCAVVPNQNCSLYLISFFDLKVVKAFTNRGYEIMSWETECQLWNLVWLSKNCVVAGDEIGQLNFLKLEHDPKPVCKNSRFFSKAKEGMEEECGLNREENVTNRGTMDQGQSLLNQSCDQLCPGIIETVPVLKKEDIYTVTIGNNEEIYCGGSKGTISRVDFASKKTIWEKKSSNCYMVSLSISREFLAAGGRKLIEIYKSQSGEELLLLDLNLLSVSGPIQVIEFTPSGREIVVLSESELILLQGNKWKETKKIKQIGKVLKPAFGGPDIVLCSGKADWAKQEFYIGTSSGQCFKAHLALQS